MERRKHKRIPVRYRSSFSSANLINGEGTALDLSLGGCRVRSERTVYPGTVLVLHLSLPDQEAEFTVEQALVRWSQNREFGVEFVGLAKPAWTRLRQVLTALEGKVSA